MFSPYITIYDLNKDFKKLDEVIWTFSKNLARVGTTRQRFNIYIVSNKESERKHLEGSIKSIWKYFDENNLEGISLSTQKQIFLELITDSFLTVSDELGWNKNYILEAKEKSLEEGIEFEFLSKPRLNQSRTKSGLVKLKLREDKVSIYAILTGKNKKETKEILLIDSFPYHISLFKTFKDYKWINEDEFGFVFSNKLTLTCSFSNQKSNWNHNNTEEDKGFIRSVTYRNFSSERDWIEWVNN